MQADNDELAREHALKILTALAQAGAATASGTKLKFLDHLFKMILYEVQDLEASRSQR